MSTDAQAGACRMRDVQPMHFRANAPVCVQTSGSQFDSAVHGALLFIGLQRNSILPKVIGEGPYGEKALFGE